MQNIYLPEKVKITKIETHSPDVKLFRLQKVKGKFAKNENGLVFNPGQFVLVGIWGYGEAPFGPASSPQNKSYLEIVVRNTGGNVTNSLHNLKEDAEITLRGPFGNGFPLQFLEKKDLVLVTGGCGIPPIASLIEHILNHRKKFGRVYLIYGAKTPNDLLLKDRIDRWEKQIKVILTVDKPSPDWTGKVGLVSEFVKEIEIDPANAVAAMCGPGPMMAALEKVFRPLGISDRRIFANVERKMQCGVGKCQHCVTGDKYVCLDGPVFYFDQIDKNWD
ncbi:MAG: FAD/NAD(P)-binding protein [bacterium]|nr:FAD/NAD(P)-binding protein [bacterium]